MEPLISVILPVYNGENLIGEAIRSVLSQTFVNWELIIVDDASTDNTCKIVQEFTQPDSRIKLIECKENFGGPARPRNVGIENAAGQFIAFLDADDKWMSHKLKKQMDYLQKNDLDLVYTESKYIGGDEGRAKPIKDLCAFLLKNPIATSSVLMKKDKICLFDEDKQLISVEDYYLWMNLYHRGSKFGLLPEQLIEYRISGDSLSHLNEYSARLKRYYAVFKFLIATQNRTSCVFFVLLQMLVKLTKLRIIEIFR